MGFFRKSENGTGSLPPRGVKCASELEDNKIGITEPSLSQRGFRESCLLGQLGPVKWKINKPAKKGTRFETKCSLQPGCHQTSKHCSHEAIKNPILDVFSSGFNSYLSYASRCQALGLGLGIKAWRDVVHVQREPTV